MDDKNPAWKKYIDTIILNKENKDKTHAKVIFLVLTLCFLVAYTMNQIDEIGKVYTHLFYIPIIITGAWFRKKAFFLAIPLSILHVMIEYREANGFTYAPFVRISVFLLVTLVVVMISQTKYKLEQELMDQIAYIQQINNSVGDVMGRCDANGIICYITPSVETILGYQQEDMIGQNFLEFIYACDQELLSKDILYTLETASEFRKEYRAVKQNKELAWLEIVMNPMLQNNECTGAVFLCSDITKRKKDETDFKEKVYRDELTGLKNRRFIDEVFEKEIEESKNRERDFSVMMVDIDFFKKVNDTYGHPVGDKVLIRLAQLLKQSVRKYDHVARFGGEEFIILLPGVDEYLAWEIAERMRELVAKNKFETVHTITISIGISIHMKDDSAVSLYKKADEALYVAKQRGRNRVAIYSTYGFMPIDFKTIVWKTAWESHQTTIDAQHKEFLEMVNLLAERQLHRISCTNISAELQKMKKKLLEHFTYEESYFEEIEFKNKEEHVEIHNRILISFERILAFAAKSEEVDILVLYQFLMDIFVGHLQTEDRLYFEYVKR